MEIVGLLIERDSIGRYSAVRTCRSDGHSDCSALWDFLRKCKMESNF